MMIAPTTCPMVMTMIDTTTEFVEFKRCGEDSSFDSIEVKAP